MHRFALLFLCISILFAGCARGPGSKAIPPPYDPNREAIDESVAALVRNAELKLGTKQDYYIGPGDILGITLVGRPDILSNDKEKGEKFTVTVTENPVITLPLIGAIKVHGKTSMQLEQEIKAAYKQFISDPVPVVTIEKYYYNQVTVLGSVRDPGRFSLDFGDTLIDSIFKAGGLTFGRETGGLPPARYLKVYREKVDNKQRAELAPEQLLAMITEADQRILPRQEIIIPIEEFILNGELSYNIPLYPNDIVFIPAAGTVMVHGRAKNPGVKFLGPSIRTLAQTITEAGGLRYSAQSRVEVVRSYADGTQESFYFNVRKMRKRQIQDFIMQDGDQIFIYVHPGRDALEFIGNVFKASVNTGANATYAPV